MAYGEVQTLDLKEFLHGLCENFAGTGPANIVTSDVPSAMIPADDAITLGLLVNELITNAVKYAYPQKQSDIHISVAQNEAGLRLEVRDHGPGLPPDQDQKKSDSLGMKLISRLSRQMGGKPEWQNAHPGTCFVLEFSV